MISAIVRTVKQTYIPQEHLPWWVGVYIEDLSNHIAVKIAGVGACMEWALVQGNMIHRVSPYIYRNTSCCDFVEADVTINETKGYLYLFNTT